MRVAMMGLGKLGLPVSCAMTKMGHKVYGYDINPELTEQLKRGDCLYYEPNINNILKESLQNGLTICDSVEDAVRDAEIIFIAVPTPSNEDDSFDTCYVKDALKQVARGMFFNKEFQVVAIISTVLPGTTRNEFLPTLCEDLGSPHVKNWGLVYNAQFIAMGTTIEDMLNPEFVLIGEYDKKSGDVLGSFYSQLVDAPLLRMSIESAETVKMAYNTMIGFKIVYANALMEICDKIYDADCDDVYGAISKATTRLLSKRYLKGGMGDGGGCLPAGELIVTQGGLKPIEQVQHGDYVLTSDGSLQKVLGTWERDYDGDLITVKVRGLPTAKVTADHRMIVAEDGRKRYKSGKRNTSTTITESLGKEKEVLAKDLTANHLIPFPTPEESVGLKAVSKWEHVCSSYIELAGWYLSEGWATASPRHGRLGFALHEKEIGIAKQIGGLCVRLDPPTKTGRRKSVKVSIRSSGDKGIMVRYGSKKLANQLVNDFGKGAQNKRIPDWLVYGPLEWAKLLMRGLWQGDGHTCEEEMFLSTISRDLAWGTHLILLRCGIPSTIRMIPERTGYDGQKHKLSYEVTVANKRYLAQMQEITGLEDKSREQPKLYDYYGLRDNCTWRHVKELICEPFKGKVYNLWVEGNHTYVTTIGALFNCHPRDNRALSWLAKELDLSADPFEFVMEARNGQSRYLAHVVRKACDSYDLPLAIMGLTFKPETNLTLDSPSLLLIEHLREMYIQPAYTFDPIIKPKPLPANPKIYVLATCHEQFKDYPFEPGSVIIDPWRMIEKTPEKCILRQIGR